MTITVTDRGFITQKSSATNPTFSAFTPASGAALVCVLTGANLENAAPPTGVDITGHEAGGDWAKIRSLYDFTGSRDFELWACFVGGSPSSASVVVDIPYTVLITCQLFELSGVDTSGTVANAFGVYDSTAGYGDVTPGVVLSAFASATNMTFAVAQQINSTPNFTWDTTDGTFTENGITTNGTWATECAYFDGEANTVGYTTDINRYSMLFATEIKAAGGGSSIVAHAANANRRRAA